MRADQQGCAEKPEKLIRHTYNPAKKSATDVKLSNINTIGHLSASAHKMKNVSKFAHPRALRTVPIAFRAVDLSQVAISYRLRPTFCCNQSRRWKK